MFKAIHPILGTRDMDRTHRFYVDRLGFTLAFHSQPDPASPVSYAGLRRDNVELHFQWQFEHEMGTTRLRLLVEDPDALYAEYQDKQVLKDQSEVKSTPWGTREFAFYDPDKNALTFYRDLRRDER